MTLCGLLIYRGLARWYMNDATIGFGYGDEFATLAEELGLVGTLLVVLIGFCFGAFLEGAAGFGAPVAITAALLVGLGLGLLVGSVVAELYPPLVWIRVVDHGIAQRDWPFIAGQLALLVVVFGVRTGSSLYLEAALIIGMLGFAATVALAKFMMRGEVIE